VSVTSNQINKLPLEPARLDLQSVKVQMVLGSLLILAACLVAYFGTLKAGFLLDDFLHLDYLLRALSGDMQDFLRNFYGNWAGCDLMKAYRPITSISLFFDCLLYGTNAIGFHLTNILLLFSCCLLVSLITLEITGPGGNRLGAAPAVWAGLLFSIYPLHAESVSWITGRVDLLCTLFFLAAIFSYLRFRAMKERPYLWSALICFWLSLISKEMAVVLPVVIVLAEVCLWSPLNTKSAQISGHTALSNRISWVMPFWALLGFYMTLRVVFLGTAIGGYSGGNMLGAWRNFLDKATLLKLLLPANEEITFAAWLKPELICCYLLVVAIVVGRLLWRKAAPGPFVWLVSWLVVGILPAFQIWHIWPNLVGSRLFFLSSAPACILIALAALPAFDALRKPIARAVSIVGLCALLGI
jgi:hypothetical protein